MSRTATETRTRILDAAESLFLWNGYGATSVEAIVGRTGVTKGAFFHHFASKQELARALIERYAGREAASFEAHVERAERLSRDPLQQVLLVVGFQEEAIRELPEPYPGCLFAAYGYQAGLFEQEILGIVRESLLGPREVLGEKLARAIERHPPRVEVDPADLADGLLVVTEGAILLSRALGDKDLIARQIHRYRTHLELLFGLP